MSFNRLTSTIKYLQLLINLFWWCLNTSSKKTHNFVVIIPEMKLGEDALAGPKGEGVHCMVCLVNCPAAWSLFQGITPCDSHMQP